MITKSPFGDFFSTKDFDYKKNVVCNDYYQ